MSNEDGYMKDLDRALVPVDGGGAHTFQFRTKLPDGAEGAPPPELVAPTTGDILREAYARITRDLEAVPFVLLPHDVRVEPTSYDECTIESLRSQLTDAIARAKVAEAMLRVSGSRLGEAMKLARKLETERDEARTRLAERDASFNRLRWRP